MNDYNINRRKFSQLITATFLGLMASGCATAGRLSYKPLPPIPKPKSPGTKTESVEDVLSHSSGSARSEGVETLPDFNKKVLGINDFDGDSKGGPLLSNTFWRLILGDYQKGKLKVVDRSKIEAVTREQIQRDSMFVDLTPIEKAKRLGKLIDAEYLWFGTVTEYHSSVQPVSLAEVFLPGEEARFQKEYDDYQAKVEANKVKLQKDIDNTGSAILGTRDLYQAELNNLIQTAAGVKALAEHEKELKTRQATTNVTSVGITASIVSVNESSKVWVFDLSTRGISLESANEVLIKTMMKSLFSKTPTMKVASL
jgi:hypothetical protein